MHARMYVRAHVPCKHVHMLSMDTTGRQFPTLTPLSPLSTRNISIIISPDMDDSKIRQSESAKTNERMIKSGSAEIQPLAAYAISFILI